MNKKGLLLIFLLVPLCALAREPKAGDEIQQLIVAVESSGCTFIRNGKSHSAEEAADHLRLKLRRGKRYADTAENFIDRLASGSSLSGKPYYLDCPGSERRKVGEWLRTQLVIIRSPAPE